MEKEATHYAYINGVKKYFKLNIQLHTNNPYWSQLKNGIWLYISPVSMDLAGLTMVEIKA